MTFIETFLKCLFAFLRETFSDGLRILRRFRGLAIERTKLLRSHHYILDINKHHEFQLM
jgi:hypothetical protein